MDAKSNMSNHTSFKIPTGPRVNRLFRSKSGNLSNEIRLKLLSTDVSHYSRTEIGNERLWKRTEI